MEDLHTENYKTFLRKKIIENVNKGERYCIHGSEDATLLRCHFSPMQSVESIYRFSAIPIEIPAGTFTETDNLILKCICECKGPE